VDRAVRFDLILNSRKYVSGGRDAVRANHQITESTKRAGNALKAATAAFSVGVVVSQMRNWVAAARDSNKTAAQTATVLKSTHGAAGLTADQFAKLAGQISKTSAVDDDLIQSGENIIATFTQIHGDVFKKTTQAAVDMAAAMNHGEVTQEGLQSASIQLGKALNDPVKGLSALQRVGVTFSAQQKDQIANFVKAGQTAKAQGVILAEVNKEFGGSAAAAVTPAKQLAVTWGNMQEVLGNLLIPAIDRGAQILNSILGVVDRNRTAFGVLFGVLGTGAAVIGTLVVAEKVHKAVTEGLAVATKTAEVAQKGLNLVFGATKVQATAVAVAEGEVAVATTGAGAAAGRTSVAFGALATRLGLLGAAVGAGVYQGTQFDDSLQKLKEHSNPLATALDKLFTITTIGGGKTKEASKATREQGLQTAYAAQQTEMQRQAMVASLPAYQTAADKARLNADAIKEMSGKLKEARGELAQNRQSMAQTIQSYDGLISKSKVTAAEVVKDIRNQVSNFKTYSSDVHRLIKAGVNPAAIQELSQKGPQYIHALARGSASQLKDYKATWVARNQEIKTSFAASIDAQYRKLAAQIRKMQAEINRLKGKTITIKARTSVEITASVRQYLAASNVPGFHAKGALIPGYGGGDIYPAMLEPGEAVIPKDKARRPDFKAWAKAMGIPGFQFGGLVTRYYNPTVSETRRIGQSMANVAAYVIKQLGGGNPAIKAFIRSTDPLPYIWGGAGPGGYDCSGLTGAVFGQMTGRGGGHGQRYFTTASNFGALGFKPGGGGAYTIGVNRAGGHMVGNYGGLAFEAANTRAGIRIGGAARSVGSMPALYHMAKGGLVGALDREALRWLTDQRLAIGGDAARLRVDRFDRGGMLLPGHLGYNGTGRAEPVGLDEDRLARKIAVALVEALRTSPPRVAVDDIHTGLLRKKNARTGGMSLGLS
jgi:hypothetical protein